ncbi:MAG: putative glycoside hydrolase [Firmicutes bacterium]|nr:putative glycoside hydrolase [Bacillota bacterium]
MINSILAFIKQHKTVFILIGLAIGIGLFSYLSAGRIGSELDYVKDGKNGPDVHGDHGDKEKEGSEVPMKLEHYMEQPRANLKLFQEPVKVKGIHVSGWVAGTKGKFNKLLKLVNETELNAMVIDVKEDAGKVTYKSEVPWTQEANSIVNMVGDMTQLMDTLKENNIYPIARIVCFKDPILGEKYPELALKKKDGSLWRDNKNKTWLNAYNPKAWDLLIELSKEAARLGFRDIQFDYVRFPTDGKVNLIDYGEVEKTKAEAIAEFLAYAKKELEPMGVDVTADIFGIMPVVPGDAEGIGQDWEMVSEHIDYVCPMVYPSHYANVAQNGVGQKINGVLYKYPDLDPYGVVYNTLVLAKERIDNSNANAKIRPWLQSFTASYLGKGNYQVYGGPQIRAQIQATYDAGLEEWLLWDANNNYTEAGLLKE